MKRISSKITFAFILSLILFVSLFAISAFAVTPVDGDITWKYTTNDTDKTATITGITISASLEKTPSFTIPDTIDIEKNGEIVSYTVTAIGNNAFNNNKKVFGALTLPNTLKSIGNNAFSGTYIVGDIVIPDSVETIGSNAFQNCPGIYHVSLSQNVTALRSSTFSKCYSLVGINTENVEIFEDNCFYECRALLKVDLSSANDVRKNVFYNCDSLSGTYDLSDISNFAASAFNNCDRITGFVIPNSFSGNILDIFAGCIALEEVEVENNTSYKSINGILFTSDEKTLVFYPFAKEGPTYKVPNKVTKIGDSAFKNNTSLDRVILPEALKEIGVAAFSYSAILDCYIPDGIKIINVDTFKGCASIQWVVVGAGVESTGIDAFASVNANMVLYNKNDSLSRPAGSYRTYVLVSEYQCVNHLYGYLDVDPTCDEYGYNKCVICGRLAYIKELGHFGPIINKVALSCTTDEYSVVKCLTCKQEVSIVTQKCTGHTASFKTVAKTETTPGYVIATCAVCRETYLESFTPHKDVACSSHNNTSIVISVSSCKTNGLEIVYCSDCGALDEVKTTPKSSCNYVVDTEIRSTCTVNGQLIEVCTICSGKKYTALPLAEHSHAWYTVSQSFGFEYSSCSVCGVFESREVDYSIFNSLLAQVSKYYEIYYAPDTVAMLKPIIDNKDMNLTQEAVDYNSMLLSNILSNIKYNVKDVPVVFIERDGALSTSEYRDATFYIAYIDENGQYQVETVERNGTMKIRGNSTANKAKNPYNIKFSSKVDLFDLGAGKKYCLMANFFDQALIRNSLAFDLAQSLGLDYTSKYKMVEVYLNGECDGLYMLTTPVDVGENRVDIDEENDFLFEITSGGHGDDNARHWMTTDGLFAPFANLKLVIEDTDKMSAETYSKMYAYYWQINYAIYSGDWEQINNWVDVDSMAKYYLLHEYLKALDYCYDSTRFYVEDGKLHGGPVWDFDYGIGNFAIGAGSGTHDKTGLAYHNYNVEYAEKSEGVLYDKDSPDGIWASTTGYWANSQWGNACGNGYFKQLYNYSPEFVELLCEYLETYDMQFTLLYEDVIVSKKEKYQNSIDKHDKDADYTAARMRNWQIYNIISDVDNACDGYIEISHNHAINYLREWLQRRHEWMKKAYVME